MRRQPRLVRPAIFALSSCISLLTGCILAGCSDEDSANRRAPDEPTVFDASSETRDETGIARWGFATEPGNDAMTYRGYDENGAVVATVEQTMDRSDPERYVFRILMKGRNASASETIQFYTRPSDDGQKAVVMMEVTENTFEEGTFPSKVLFRFKADAKTRGGIAGGSGTSLLAGRSRPLNEGAAAGPQPAAGGEATGGDKQQELVSRCNETKDKCQVALIDQRIAAAGEASECSLLKRVGVPLMEGAVGAGVGLLYSWWTGPFAAGPVVVGAGAGVAAGVASQSVQCASSRRDAADADKKNTECKKEQEQSCKQ